MMLHARFRSSLISPGLRLVAVGSLVAAVALFTYALHTSAHVDAESAGTELSDSVQADNDAPDFSATNAPVSSSMIAAAASARAEAQLDAMRMDTTLEWTAALTLDSGLTNDASLSSTTVEGIDRLALLLDGNPWAAEWLPPAIEDTPLTLADVAAHRFGGVGFGGGASSGSGGGAAGGGSGAGGISGRPAGAPAQSTLQTPRALQPGGDDHKSGSPSEQSSHNSGDSRADDRRGGGNDGPSIASVARGFDAPPASREPVSVPEPSSAVLAALGLASLAATRMRRRAGR